jgi:putative ATP-binding cassette transporter
MQNIVFRNLKQHIAALCIMIGLTVLSSLLGIAVLMFINTRLLNIQPEMTQVLMQFIVLLLVYLVISTLAQMSLTRLGHGFVYSLRKQLLKQIMDTSLPRIQEIGKAKIMASLASDIQSISYMFVRMPELVQGGMFIFAAGAYLVYLSPALSAMIVLWVAATLLGGYWTVQKVYGHLVFVREKDNALYQHYESAIDGHKELTLNRYRAERFYDTEFDANAKVHCTHMIRADDHHAFANNWTNAMMLGAVGFVFYLAYYHQWASIEDATTIAVAVLFIRTPLISAVGAFPTLLQGRVSLKSLDKLGLCAFESGFHQQKTLPEHWQTVRLDNVSYIYGDKTHPGFALAPLNFTLRRGETVFVVGENGSGKSTLSMLLSGLYPVSEGAIYLDDERIDASNIDAYRALFASVFTQFHLFEHLQNGYGEDAPDQLIAQWLAHLQLDKKVRIEAHKILNRELSQGQKKRLGLLTAALEQRNILVLDEWAADQDPEFRKVFYERLLPILKAQGYTIFAISHDDKYFHLADRIVRMHQGVLQELSAADAAGLIAQPAVVS